MKLIKTAACGLLAVAMLSGCATKRYPIATTFSSAEAAAMDCSALRLELIRSEQVQAQIAATSQTDWRSAAGFLGDFGIGNAMAKSEADRAITQRIAAIRTAQADKSCTAGAGVMSVIQNFVSDLID